MDHALPARIPGPGAAAGTVSATAVGSVGVADGAQGVEAAGAIRVGLRSLPPDIRDLTIDGPMMEGYKTLQPVFHLFSRLRGLLVMGTPLASLPAVLGASPTLVDLTLRCARNPRAFVCSVCSVCMLRALCV